MKDFLISLNKLEEPEPKINVDKDLLSYIIMCLIVAFLLTK